MTKTEDIFYNFNKERVGIMILGGYSIVKKPLFLLLMNTLYVFGILSVCVFLEIMAMNTVILTSNEKMLAVQASKVIFMLLVCMCVPVVRYVTNDNLKIAIELLKRGVFQYENAGLNHEQINIKKKRIRQIRLFVKLITWMLNFNVASSALTLPLIQFFKGAEMPPDGLLNPYLPLPVHMPFDTKSILGFAAAFLSVTLALFFMNITYICHEEVYISSSLQLCAQLEILSHSLNNIERRAHFKLKKKMSLSEESSVGNLYDRVDFQRCLYSCLRENVQHHQVILRYNDAMKPYMETTTSIASLSISLLMACELILLAENPGQNMALIMMLLSEMCSYLQISWVGQMITDKSNETKESLYATPWTFCDRKFNVLLSVMITNMQKPIVLKSKGLNIVVSLETFGNMMALGYKIMNVLRESVD